MRRNNPVSLVHLQNLANNDLSDMAKGLDIMKKVMTFEQAKAHFVHRFTMDFVPTWAQKPVCEGKFYAPHFASDREWFENTVFPPANGLRKYCTTNNQSWPLGQWLNKPYKV